MTARRLAVAVALLVAACRPPLPEPDRRAPAPEHPRLPELTARPERLTLGLLPVTDPAGLLRQYGPLAAHVGERLGVPVEVRVSRTYDGLLERLAAGEIDFVRLAPLAYVRATRRLDDLQILASGVSGGVATYSAYLLARRHAAIETPADLKGKRFGFVDKTSTSGYLYPMAFLIDSGFTPGSDWASATFLGRHDTVIGHLISEQIDVGATWSGALQQERARGLPVDDLTIIAKTGRVPLGIWCARGDLDSTIAEALRRLLLGLSMGDSAGRKALGPIEDIDGFVEASADDFNGVRAVLERVESSVSLAVEETR